MSNKKKVLIWLVVFSGMSLLVGTFLSQEIGKWILFFVACTFVWWFIQYVIIEPLPIDEMCNSIDRRFRRIEHRIGLLDDADEKDLLIKPVAYKIHLGLLPHWEQILEKLAEQNEQKSDEFIEEISNDKELGIETGTGLFGKNFWFDIYQDELSGMQQIWSHHHKALVDSWVIQGHLFEPWPWDIISRAIPKKYAYNYVRQPLTLSTWMARFDRFYGENDVISGMAVNPCTGTPYNDVFKEGKVANIPYFEIIKLLLELGKILMPHTYAIKQFPKKLQKRLEESNIRYDNEPYSFQNCGTEFDVSKNEDSDTNEIGWNDKQWFKDKGIKLHQDKRIDSHIFHTPYYSVSINLEIFEPPRLPYRL